MCDIRQHDSNAVLPIRGNSFLSSHIIGSRPHPPKWHDIMWYYVCCYFRAMVVIFVLPFIHVLLYQWCLACNVRKNPIIYIYKSWEIWRRIARCYATFWFDTEQFIQIHFSDVIMSATTSQITGFSIVCSTVCWGADQRNIKAPRQWPLWGESTGDR